MRSRRTFQSKLLRGAFALLLISGVAIFPASGSAGASDTDTDTATATDETSSLYSAHQIDLQIQQLVKTLSKSLVTVQIASRTSPFESAATAQAGVGAAKPIYLRNVSALAVDSGGYLICAAALLSDQDSLWMIRDGVRYRVDRIGIDFRSGLALLKSDAPGLVPATYVRQAPASGAMALFLKSSGVESVEPTLAFAGGSSSVDGYLEYTGPVGSGTVGGAFFNMDGHLLGLALGSLSGGGSTNRVFVLPVSRIEPIVMRLKCCGDREAGYLGIQVVNTLIRGFDLAKEPKYGSSQTSSETQARFAVQEQASSGQGQTLETKGALITVVEDSSPAFEAGLVVGDVVYLYDNQTVTTAESLRDYVRGCAPDSVISLAFLRGSQRQLIKVSLSKAPLAAASPGESVGGETNLMDPKAESYEALILRIRQLEERIRSLEDNR